MDLCVTDKARKRRGALLSKFPTSKKQQQSIYQFIFSSQFPLFLQIEIWTAALLSVNMLLVSGGLFACHKQCDRHWPERAFWTKTFISVLEVSAWFLWTVWPLCHFMLSAGSSYENYISWLYSLLIIKKKKITVISFHMEYDGSCSNATNYFKSCWI